MAPVPLRLALRALGAVSPTAASRLAERMFFTPRRHVRPARETELLASGQPFDFVYGVHVLKAWSWGEGPVIALMHGWEGRGAQLGAVIAPLVRAGYRVVTFDAPAHGDSPGTQSNPVEFAEALHALSRWVGGLYGVVAHSMGAIAVPIALRRGLELERVVFIAPGVSPDRATELLGEFLDLEPAIRDQMREQMAGHLGLTWAEFQRAALMRGMDTPLRVIHDKDDKEVELSNAERIVVEWSGAELVTTEGLGHRRILRDEDVLAAAVDFLGPVPPSARRPVDPWKAFLHADHDFGFDVAAL